MDNPTAEKEKVSLLAQDKPLTVGEKWARLDRLLEKL